MSVRVNVRFPEPPRQFPVPIVHVELLDEANHDWQPDGPSLVITTVNGLPIGQVYCDRGGFDRSAFLAGDDKHPAEGVGRKPSTASVVICTRDRPDDLARCLASFPAQKRRPDEVIVVDNASKDDRTRQVALAAGVTYVREDRPGLDFARNTGARTAKSEIVAYTDDDVVLHPFWLENLVAAFDMPDIVAVTGLVLPGALKTEAQYIFETEWGFGRGYQVRIFDERFYNETRQIGSPVWEVGAGASMAFRKKVFSDIGYFDERLDVGAAGCSGDSEFWYRILHFGGKCRYEPTAVAYHFHRETEEGLGRQLRAYMSGHTAALLVQYERTGEFGNLRHLFYELPKHYLRKIAKRIIRGRNYENFFLKDEMIGCVKGVWFYLTAKRSVE
jgi:glycosyltransferase involved in cell wall biosynthesis